MPQWRSSPQSEGDRQAYLSVNNFAISTTPTLVLARPETVICDPGRGIVDWRSGFRTIADVDSG